MAQWRTEGTKVRHGVARHAFTVWVGFSGQASGSNSGAWLQRRWSGSHD